MTTPEALGVALPAPAWRIADGLSPGADLYTADQLTDFAAEVRAKALEDAAQVCEDRAGTVSMFATSREARDHNATVRGCAAAIRAMK